MRLNSPRIAPLPESKWTDEQRAVLEPFAQRNQLFNIYSTLGNNPDALKAFLAWGSYVLRRSQLEPRQRELLILRVGFLCRAGYEWAQHSRLGIQVGLTSEEINRIKLGTATQEWNEQDSILLTATDELLSNHFIANNTWEHLRAFLNESQCMDVVFIVGHYTQVCMMLNSFGIQLDEGLVLDSDFLPDNK